MYSFYALTILFFPRCGGSPLIVPIALLNNGGSGPSANNDADSPTNSQTIEIKEAASLHLSGSALTQPFRNFHLSGVETALHISGVPLAEPVLEIHLSGRDMDSHISGALSRRSFQEIHLSGSVLELHVSGATLFQPLNPLIHLSGTASTF